MDRSEIIRRRRELAITGYSTLADVGLDGEWVSPYQIISNSSDGPCLIAYNWLDAPSVMQHRTILLQKGYLPDIPFNNVMELALSHAGLARKDIYVTQAFHLLPQVRSQGIPQRLVDESFDRVTRHEVMGRYVVAPGDAAAIACRRHGVKAIEVCHPSSRSHGTYSDRARIIGSALKR